MSNNRQPSKRRIKGREDFDCHASPEEAHPYLYANDPDWLDGWMIAEEQHLRSLREMVEYDEETIRIKERLGLI